MDVSIEIELSKFKSHIIDHATLRNIFSMEAYSNINDKINRLKKEGVLKTLKKGLYVHNSPVNKTIVSKEIISNILLGPSYISLDYALFFHGLIPESVHESTNITTKRSKSFNTEYGVFSYKHINKELFALGLILQETNKGNFIIAGKEKALCDKIYFSSNADITSKNAMLEFIENDLRIDIDDLKDLDLEIISEYFKISKSKKIKIFLNLIQQL